MRYNFRKLLNRVSRKDDRILFEEAISCAKSGNNRAAYIMTWLSVAESIKARFKELSGLDKNAGIIKGEIEEKESNNRPIDKYLIKSAYDYGIINKLQNEKISDIYKMRCIYAHPYNEAPDIEELISIMKYSVDCILSQPTLFKYGYIVNLCTDLFESYAFLLDDKDTVINYAEKVATRTCPSVYVFTINMLCGKVESIIDMPAKELFSRRGIVFIESFMQELDTELTTDEWSKLIKNYPKTTTIVLTNQLIWSRLPEQAQNSIIATISSVDHSASFEELNNLYYLHDNKTLTEPQNKKLYELLENINLTILVHSNIPMSYYTKKIIDELKIHNWYSQNPVISSLLEIGANKIKKGTVDNQNQLGRNVLQAAEGNARQAVRFIRDMALGEIVFPYEFIRGLVYECFIDDNYKLRFKTACMKNALLGSIKGCINPNIKILTKLNTLLRSAEPKYDLAEYNDHIFSTVYDILDEVVTELGTEVPKYIKVLEKLKHTLTEVHRKLKEHNDD